MALHIALLSVRRTHLSPASDATTSRKATEHSTRSIMVATVLNQSWGLSYESWCVTLRIWYHSLRQGKQKWRPACYVCVCSLLGTTEPLASYSIVECSTVLLTGITDYFVGSLLYVFRCAVGLFGTHFLSFTVLLSCLARRLPNQRKTNERYQSETFVFWGYSVYWKNKNTS